MKKTGCSKSIVLRPTKCNHDTSDPLMSIGLAVYNGDKYIRQALDSLIAQDYENFELIISNNASTDTTKAICEK